MALRKEIKEKWIEALESGKYQQGVGTLCRDGRYCCLGVLADVMGRLETRLGDRLCVIGRGTGGINTAFLPEDFLGEVGRFDQAPLVGMNDRGEKFPVIAAYIRENL